MPLPYPTKKSLLRVSVFHEIYLCLERIVFRFRGVLVVPFWCMTLRYLVRQQSGLATRRWV